MVQLRVCACLLLGFLWCSVSVARGFLDRVYHELPQRCSVSVNSAKTRTNFTHTIRGPTGHEGDGLEIQPKVSTVSPPRLSL